MWLEVLPSSRSLACKQAHGQPVRLLSSLGSGLSVAPQAHSLGVKAAHGSSLTSHVRAAHLYSKTYAGVPLQVRQASTCAACPLASQPCLECRISIASPPHLSCSTAVLSMPSALQLHWAAIEAPLLTPAVSLLEHRSFDLVAVASQAY